MTTTWKSGDKKPNNQATNNTISGTMLSSWSRQQKLVLKARYKTGAGRRLQPCVEFGSACSGGGPCNRSNHHSVPRNREEDIQEASRERHL